MHQKTLTYLTLIIFGITFAFIESSVILYLHQLLSHHPLNLAANYTILLNLGFIAFVKPQDISLINSHFTSVEMIREFSTLIVIGCFAYLAGQTIKQKLGAYLIAFAIWDIFYYLFLALILGWPTSLLDLDIFFLLPVPWIGPVITPLIISTLLFLLGTKLYHSSEIT